MSIVYRKNLDRPLTSNEVDSNFKLSHGLGTKFLLEYETTDLSKVFKVPLFRVPFTLGEDDSIEYIASARGSIYDIDDGLYSSYGFDVPVNFNFENDVPMVHYPTFKELDIQFEIVPSTELGFYDVNFIADNVQNMDVIFETYRFAEFDFNLDLTVADITAD